MDSWDAVPEQASPADAIARESELFFLVHPTSQGGENGGGRPRSAVAERCRESCITGREGPTDRCGEWPQRGAADSGWAVGALTWPLLLFLWSQLAVRQCEEEDAGG